MGATGRGPYGSKRALRACRLRVPDGISEEAAALADAALQRILEVMAGTAKSALVLRAATRVRDEICGPPAQRMISVAAPPAPLIESAATRSTRELANTATGIIESDLARLRALAGAGGLNADQAATLNAYSRTLLQQAESQERLLTARRDAVAALSDEELMRETERALQAMRAKEPSDAPA